MKPATRLWLYLSLLPVFGVIPAGWALSQRSISGEQRQVSRLALVLAFTWMVGYGSFNLAGGVGEAWGETTALFLNSLWTSGYFLTLFWLMTRLSRNQSLNLPLFSYLARYLP